MSRGTDSLKLMVLSYEDVSRILDAVETGSAKPRLTPRPCPPVIRDTPVQHTGCRGT
jgi:hypothetical protein